MKIARILLAVAAFAAITQAGGWNFGSTSSGGLAPIGPGAQNYTIVGVMNETSCPGTNACPSTSVGATAYTVFYVAKVGGSFAGEAVVVDAPNRADSKLIIDGLLEAYRNGWKVQVANWFGAGTVESVSWQNVSKLYRVKQGDKVLVYTTK
ncbi:MAG: hypothetical protein RL173_3053 [Fibrobacterota bacterium]|jgi:hypothetical protein